MWGKGKYQRQLGVLQSTFLDLGCVCACRPYGGNCITPLMDAYFESNTFIVWKCDIVALPRRCRTSRVLVS